ncbi:MAG: glycosyltransferase family 2 protein [Candidatus Omnitrophica bacterium]|nr:glycosyltransferase family 2 protein [Candidatus Omnitrophota bacterium]MDD5429421.1 glycosyltransferase family 2 protein [Candidatus Omnitrophota bacterium]
MKRNGDFISIVIPIYNENQVITELYGQLNSVLSNLKIAGWEIIFVDDGSTDGSWESIGKLNSLNDKVRGIKLSKNFGHQFAISAGLDYVKGNAVIMMDADLQHPPELIPKLIEKWEEGYDIVYTVREDTGSESLFKRVTSRFFYNIFNKLSKSNIPYGAADFRLLDETVVIQLKSFKERVRFLRGIINWVGYKKIGVSYAAQERFQGKSKYSFLKMVHLAISGIISFSSAPLYISAILGIVIAGLSFFYGLYAILVRIFTEKTMPGWTSILVSMLFLGGVQLIAIGILGEYLAKVYEEVKGRPLYIVDKKIGF